MQLFGRLSEVFGSKSSVFRYSGQNRMAKFFLVMKSEHELPWVVWRNFRCEPFWETTTLLCESTLEGRLAASYCATRSSRYVEDTDRVWNVFGMLNIIRDRIKG